MTLLYLCLYIRNPPTSAPRSRHASSACAPMTGEARARGGAARCGFHSGWEAFSAVGAPAGGNARNVSRAKLAGRDERTLRLSVRACRRYCLGKGGGSLVVVVTMIVVRGRRWVDRPLTREVLRAVPLRGGEGGCCWQRREF